MKRELFLLLIACRIWVTCTAQNVGIGTAAPTEKLHVAGNVKADTIKPDVIKIAANAATGKILTSDPSGNASWQEASTAGSVGFGPWGTDCATIATIGGYEPVADSAGVASDRFGNSVAISGNFAIIGAPYDDVGPNVDQGSVSVYQSNGTNWVFMQKITDATGAANDYFGFFVAISGNFAIVGSYLDDGAFTDQGSASVYQYNGTSWVLMQKLTDPTGSLDDEFGSSVSISGNTAVVGSIFDDVGANTNQGSASIFQYNGTSWIFVQQLLDPTGATNDFFGRSVSISGNYIAVGASSDDVGANSNQGSASIYLYNGSSWVFMQQITDATGATSDAFGVSVSVSGNYFIAGAFFDDVGANTDQGSVSIYQYNGATWTLMQKLTDPSGATNDNFGGNVFISENYAIVGAQGDDVNANTNQGSASIYLRVGQGWQRLQYLTDPAGATSESMGIATSIEGSTQRFLIGIIGYAGSSGKAIFGKIH